MRREVARNPSISVAVMEQLADDPEEEVRFYLSINKAINRDVLEKLTSDSSERVRRYAGERLEHLGSGKN